MNKIKIKFLIISLLFLQFNLSCTKDDFDSLGDLSTSGFLSLNQSCKFGKLSEQTVYNSSSPQFMDNFGTNVSGACYDLPLACTADMGHFHPHQNTNCFSQEMNPEKYKKLQLNYLNKCVWLVYDGYNGWITPNPHDPKKATVYRSDFVSIQQDSTAEDSSALVLKAGYNPDYDPEPTKQNCGLNPNEYPNMYNPNKDRGWGNWGRGRNCVNATGQIYSSYYDESRPGINKYLKRMPLPPTHEKLPSHIKDKFTRFGRYEVRAKVKGKNFIFPAYWMLSDFLLSGDESGAGMKVTTRENYVTKWDPEIDIWESSFHTSQGKKGFHSYHYWGQDYHASSSGDVFVDQTKQYYTYGIEWRPIKGDENKLEPKTEVLFFVEDCVVHKVQEGDMGRDNGVDKVMKTALYPMTLILGSIIPGDLMDYDHYQKNDKNYYEEIWIDWIKVYQ